MSDVDKIVLDGQVLNIKDSVAREKLNSVVGLLSGTSFNVIMIGDSYGEQNDGSITNFYWNIIREKLGLTENVNFRHGFQSGAGFGNNGFLTQLQNISNGIADKTQVTDIFVCGGWNDSDKSQSYGTDSAFNSGITNFMTI